MAGKVEADRYDTTWIASAWGEDYERQLLVDGDLVPRPRVSRALQLCDVQQGMRVLDIACGRGEVPQILSEMGCESYGIDYSEAVLNVASKLQLHREKRATKGGASLSYVRGDAAVLPFDDQTFDRITMLDIIEHLIPEQLDAMFSEVKRVLKPDGYAVMHTLPNRWVYDYGYFIARLVQRDLPAEPRGEIERQVHVNEQDLLRLGKTLRALDLGCELWLEQLIPAQARWQKQYGAFHDKRDAMYPKLAGPIGNLLSLCCKTPLKLILSNDIYGILWTSKRPRKLPIPSHITESLMRVFI
jgi:ubiquinone/menaquinone biosynthesis C-methylase UbiE